MDKVFQDVLALVASIRASDGSWQSYLTIVPKVLALIQDVLALMPTTPDGPVMMAGKPMFAAMQAESIGGICNQIETMDQATAIGDGKLLAALMALLLKLLPLFV